MCKSWKRSDGENFCENFKGTSALRIAFRKVCLGALQFARTDCCWGGILGDSPGLHRTQESYSRGAWCCESVVSLTSSIAFNFFAFGPCTYICLEIFRYSFLAKRFNDVFPSLLQSATMHALQHVQKSHPPGRPTFNLS